MEAVPRTVRTFDRIVLAGFMGSGKSTVGRLLAKRLNWQFADLDQEIETREGLGVPAIFAQRGEAAFRQAELEVLTGLLRLSGVVIALGGGAPETAAVRHLLVAEGKTKVVHLNAPFPVLYERCLAQAQDPAAMARPLLSTYAAAEARYTRRLNLYTSLAPWVVDVSAAAPETIADIILDRLAL